MLDVIRGLKELKSFIEECRELEGFDAQKDNLKRYADRLTYAGAYVAEAAQSQEALDVSVELLELLRKYSGELELHRLANRRWWIDSVWLPRL